MAAVMNKLLLCIILAFTCNLNKCIASVIELTDENYDQLVTDSSQFWLLEFYSPRCGHCISLAPILESASKKVVDLMSIGKIDATVNKKLAERFAINSYPTLKYFKDGHVKPYKGGRTEADFEKFALKMHGDAVQSLTSLGEYANLLLIQPIVFTYGYDADDQGHLETLTNIYRPLAEQYQDAIQFASTTNKQVLAQFKRVTPFIAVAENGEEPKYFPADQKFTQDAVEQWIQTNRNPIFPELDGHNFNEIAKSRRLLVMGCIAAHEGGEKNAKFLGEMRKIAHHTKSILSQNAKETFAFGWLDGTKYSTYVSQYFVFEEDLPKMVILDTEEQVFYEDQALIYDEKHLAVFLEDVAMGNKAAYHTGLWGWPSKVQRGIQRWYPWSAIGIVAIMSVVFGILKLLSSLDDDDIEVSHIDSKKDD